MMDTLVREPYTMALDHLLQNAKQKDFFLTCKNRESAHEFERGEISQREFFHKFYKNDLAKEVITQLPKPIKVKKYLLQNLHYISGMQDLIESLLQKKDHVQIGIASNYSEWYENILSKLSLLNKCDYLFFSCEMGVRKPEKEYYEVITRALEDVQKNLSPSSHNTQKQQILFIDDRQINIDGARKAGWQTHLMKNSYEAKKAIKVFLKN